MTYMKSRFHETQSSSSSEDDKRPSRGNKPAQGMAQDIAFLRLLKHNHKQKTALDKKSAPVQVDPYMLK